MKVACLNIIILLCCLSSAYCQYDSLKPQGIYTSNFIIDQTPRNLTYYMPLQYGKLEDYPLLIFLHDKGSSAQNIIKKYGELIHAKADSVNCVVMYPDAVAGRWHIEDSVNDIAFLTIMLTFFTQQYHCNANRIYLLGIGNGGNMCYHFICKSSSVVSAITSIQASSDWVSEQNCLKKESVPILNITTETNIKSAISKSFDFLFSQGNSR